MFLFSKTTENGKILCFYSQPYIFRVFEGVNCQERMITLQEFRIVRKQCQSYGSAYFHSGMKHRAQIFKKGFDVIKFLNPKPE